MSNKKQIIKPIKFTNNDKIAMSYIEQLNNSLSEQFALKYNLVGRSKSNSYFNIVMNKLCNNGSVMINTSIVSKENKSEIAWTIIDDPYIKKD